MRFVGRANQAGRVSDFTRSRNDSRGPNILTVGKCPATLPRSRLSVNRPSRPKDQQISANKKVVTSRDHTPRSFASFRVAAKRLVVDALLNLEGTDRFGGIGGFVNVSRHRDNLLVNGLDAFLFGKEKFFADATL